MWYNIAAARGVFVVEKFNMVGETTKIIVFQRLAVRQRPVCSSFNALQYGNDLFVILSMSCSTATTRL